MEQKLSRRDIGYTIISRFEETIRRVIARAISTLYSEFSEGVPKGIILKASDRAGQAKWDNAEEFLENTDFPDLSEISRFNGQYDLIFDKKHLTMADFCSGMEKLYDLRCKVAHVRQIFTSHDLDFMISNTKNIVSAIEVDGKEFLEFVDVLLEQPEKFVLQIPIGFWNDSVINPSGIRTNLPIPDYDSEGGFIGRDDEVQKVSKLLDSYPVVTIAGAGGVGKTAIALQVAQKQLSRVSQKYDGIIWLSAKENKLTQLGIEDVEPAIKNYEELLDTILEVMGFGKFDEDISKKEENVQTLLSLYEKILIIIDNLETITDERILNFILEIHANVKILITSRRGLGQVERRYDLKQMKEKEAVIFFRTIAREKNLNSLSKLDENTLLKYVRKVACYPLAIKWVIGQIALGRDIELVAAEIHETTSDISKFCFSQIFQSLTASSRRILCALSVFEEPPTAGVLKYVVDLEQTKFEDAIAEIILVSLAYSEQSKNQMGEVISRYSLLSLTRGYVKQQLDTDSVLKREIVGKLQEFSARVRRNYGSDQINNGRLTDDQQIANIFVTTAIEKSQLGFYADALVDFKKAQNLAPRFPSIYRQWAITESNQGHSLEAEELMVKASKLDPSDSETWLIWGNVKRKEGKDEESLQKYEEAYKISSNDSRILNGLGQAKSRLGHYEEAYGLFNRALQDEKQNTNKHKVINYTSLAETLYSWAKRLEKDRDYEKAGHKLIESLNNCEQLIQLDPNDEKSHDQQRKVLLMIGELCEKTKNYEQALLCYKKVIPKNWGKANRYKERQDIARAALRASLIYLHQLQNESEAKQVFPKEIKRLENVIRDKPYFVDFEEHWSDLYESQPRIKGEIIRVESSRGFAIIESDDDLDTYFAHFNSFHPTVSEMDEKSIGTRVNFIPIKITVGNDVRKDAKRVRIEKIK